MTQPVLRAVGTGVTYAQANSTVPKPTGTVSGDLMLAFLEADGNIGVADWSTLVPAGWTILYQELTGGTFTWWPMVAYKVAGGSEPASYAFSFGVQAGRGVIAAWSGVDNASPINASAQQINSTSSTTHNCPSVTPTVGDCMLVVAYFRRSSTGYPYTAPAGMTVRYNPSDVGVAGSNFGAAELGLASTASATGIKAAAGTNANTSYCVSVALTPSVPPTLPSDLSGSVTLTDSVAAGSFTTTASGIAGSITLDDSVAAGSFGTLPGVITTLSLKNNTGTLLANVTGIVVNFYNPTTGALILRKTGLASSGAAVLTITDALLVPGTTYVYEVDLTASSLGRILPTGVAV